MWILNIFIIYLTQSDAAKHTVAFWDTAKPPAVVEQEWNSMDILLSNHINCPELACLLFFCEATQTVLLLWRFLNLQMI